MSLLRNLCLCVSDISSAFFNQTERVVTVKFSKQEKKEYAALESVARTFYENLVQSGKEIGKNYLKLTSQLVPLRVACAGGKVPLDDTSEAEPGDEPPDGDVPKKRKKVQKFSDFAFTSKLNTLIAELEAVRTKDPTAKCLVFSQYTSTLKWLKEELPKHGFQYRTLSGDMSMSNRARALQDFQNDPPTTIFLLSMRAGAVGINLTQANNVFLMEPCFNAAITAQAVGRVSFRRDETTRCCLLLTIVRLTFSYPFSLGVPSGTKASRFNHPSRDGEEHRNAYSPSARKEVRVGECFRGIG